MEEAVYFWSALVGCTLLLIQVILQVIGLGGDGDFDAGAADVDADFDVDSGLDAADPAHGTAGNLFFGILSFKALVAFAGIFGLTGLSLQGSDHSPFQRAAMSVVAGLAAMVVVGLLMRMLYRLGSSGSLVVRNALGHQGQVYLRIPAAGQGRGKVTLELQGRSVELDAVTDGEEIETGRAVKIVDVLGGDTLKVVSI
jgi:hypothetical protein